MIKGCIKIYRLLLLFIILFLCGCNSEKDFVPDKIEAGHSFYNEDFSSYLIVSSDTIIENNNLIPRYGLTIHMRVSRGTNRRISYYQIDWIGAEDDYDCYYFIAKDSDKRYVGQKFLPHSVIKGNEIKTIRAYFKYHRNWEGNFEEKEYAYEEEILTFPDDEFGNDLSETENIIDFGAFLNDNDSQNYRFKFYIDFLNADRPIHVDFQSWYETVDGKIMPLTGIYNYTAIDNYVSVTDEKISKDIDMADLYYKLICYDGENVYTGQYKVSIDELRTAA